MFVDRIEKEDTDRARATLDMTWWLDPGEKITSILSSQIIQGLSGWSEAPYPSSNIPPYDPTPLLFDGVSIGPTGTNINVYIKLGTPGLAYTCQFVLLGSSTRKVTIELGVQVVIDPTGLPGTGPGGTGPIPSYLAVTVSDTPPSNPQPGQLWFDSSEQQMFVWYVDPTSAQWVIANTGGGSGSTAISIDSSSVFNQLSVKTFGAVGDGVADDVQAIRDTVIALGGQPGVIYFPPGRYAIGGLGVVIPSGTRLTGGGPGVSVIVPKNMAPQPSGNWRIFCNTNLVTVPGGVETTLPTIPSNQTDHDIQIDNLGFDLSQATVYTVVFAFLLARDLIVDRVSIYKPRDTTGFSGFRFVGCDNISVTNYTARGAQNAIDCWKGSTRLRVHNMLCESYQGGGNGGQINWNGNGSYIADFGHATDLQISKATFWLYSGIALFLDCLGPGSSTENMLLDGVVISARTGTNNTGIVCRGWVNRLKCRNISFDAKPGADMTPFNVGGLFTTTPTQAAAANRITTTLDSNRFTVSWSDGCILGPGNYMHIGAPDPDHPTLNGNGLALNGYYKIIAVSGPIHDPGAGVLEDLREGRAPNATSNGNLFTCVVEDQVANASGPINVVTGVQGFFGHPKSCEFQGITFDGISALGSDLMRISCNVLRIDGVTVTDNYNGFLEPQYRAIVGATDSIRLDGEFKVRAEISGVVGREGTKTLGGWKGNNKVAWDQFSFTPVLSEPLTGTFTPELQFAGQPGAVSVSGLSAYTEQAGDYTRVGNMVFFTLRLAIRTKSGNLGAAAITGLPFQQAVGQARGNYTANFGISKVALAPSGSTTPIVYTDTVNTLTYTITNPGSGGKTGNYFLTLTGGTGSGGSAIFRIVGTDAVTSSHIDNPGSGGTDGTYRCPFKDGGGTASVDGLDDIWITVVDGGVTQTVVHTPGKNYTSAPGVNLSSIPGLTGAAVSTTLGNGSISSVTPASRGSYTVPPAASIPAGGPDDSGVVGAVITVGLNTTGASRRTEIVGRISVDGFQLMFDVDAAGVVLTSSEFSDGCILRMVGWYFLFETVDTDIETVP